MIGFLCAEEVVQARKQEQGRFELQLTAQGDHPGYQRRCALTARCGDGAQNKGDVDKEYNEDLYGEMFFLYVYLAAVVVLLLGARQLKKMRPDSMLWKWGPEQGRRGQGI